MNRRVLATGVNPRALATVVNPRALATVVNPRALATVVNRRALAAAVERRVLHRLVTLSPRTQLRLAGGRPFEVGDDVLDPGIQLILTLQRRRGLVTLNAGTPELTRRWMREQARLTGGAPTAVGSVRDLTVDGADGPLPARHYAPPGGGHGRPLLLFLHGGGFVVGDLDGHDEPCRLLCRHADVHVLSVDYRLAPEHPFPAAVEDACAAWHWAHDHAGALGADPDRVAVGGDSAGANLSTVAAYLTVRAGGPAPAAQLLIYPPTDYHSPWESRKLFADGLLLTAADIEWFHRHYIAAGEDPDDVRHSPLRAGDLSGMPPTVLVTAAFDPLRDEGEAYADALRAAGTTVVSWRVPGMVHGFLNMTTLSRAAREAVIEIAGATRALLAGTAVRTAGPR
jgi:acetyl esterase